MAPSPSESPSLLRSILKHPFTLAFIILLVVAIGGLTAMGLLKFPSFTKTMDFALRQKVSAASDLNFSFPALMDHGSVEANIEAPADTAGTWIWENDTLTFKPEKPLKSGGTYVFRLNGLAQKSDGQPLGKALEFTFVVAGPPKLAARIPTASALDVSPSSKITLVFDRPMIPLTQVQGTAAQVRMANWPVKITPEVAGRWRWLSTSAVEFVPENALLPSTRYSVSVPKGIPTVSGDATGEDFSWSFETARPRVISSSPEEGYSLAGPTTELSISFNQEMNPETLKKYAVLTKGSENGSGTIVPISSIAFGTKEVDKKKIEDSTTLIFLPGEAFSFDSQYTLKIKKGFTASRGSLGNETGFTFSFSTVGPLSCEGIRYEYGGIHVQCSNPIAEDSIKNQITISPEVNNWDEVQWSLNSWADNRELTAYPDLKPSTKYTLTLGTGFKDTFGQSLGKPFSGSFTTDSLPSQISLDSKGEFGIFERGKAPIYYLKNVNVTKINAELSKLTLKDFLLLRSNRYGPVITLPDSREKVAEWNLASKAKHDEWETNPFDMEKLGKQSLGAGIYALNVETPNELSYDGKPLNERQYFSVTNIALTLKYSGDHALVWATDMQTGEPVSSALINFHSLNGDVVLTGKTDKDGFLDTPMSLSKFITPMNEWEPEFWVTAEKGGDFAFVSSQWNDGIRPDAFGYSSDFWYATSTDERVESYVYTERPLYRAGDTVDFKGLVRLRTRKGILTIPGKDRTVYITVNDANGNQVFSETLPFTSFGSFSGTLPIDPKAALGDYYLSAHIVPESDYPEFGTSFSVLAYRKPEYRVDVSMGAEDYFNKDAVNADIAGSYYFGAAMGGAHVSWRAQTTDYFFNKFTDGWYSFSLEDSWCWRDCERKTEMISQGEGTLDATGHLAVSVPVSIDASPLSQILTIEADITDPNNQIVSNRASVPVHKANAYVGVRPEDYVVTPGKEAKIGVVTVQIDGKPLPNTSVSLQLFSRKWNTVKKKGVDGEYYYDNTPEDVFIRGTSVTTNENGKATAEIEIPNGGEFRVVAAVKDSEGREAKSATSVYAWSSTYINWPHSNNDRIDVLADKPEYKIGDTATLLVKSPYQGKGVKALVTIEREQIIQKEVIDIESSAQAIRIPITEDLIPNAYVSVVVVKPRMGETFDSNGLDTGSPSFKIGYAKLTVEKKAKQLTLGVKTDKEQYLPGEKVEVTLTASDWQGKPVRAELSLGSVDLSLLALTGFSLPDPVGMFYSDRGMGVYTAEMLKYLIERYKPGSKGGGGAELDMRKRGEFKDTAYWNPSILTDDKGEAKISFTLPDNLTTWHFLAIGQTKDSLFGATEKTVLVTKNVIVRPVRPRFGVVGDRIVLGAIVHNFLPGTQKFTVSLSGSGFVADSTKSQVVEVEQGKTKKLSFPVTISRAEKAIVNFKAENEKARDEVEESFPILTYGTPQSAATTGVTDTGTTEKVLAPTKQDASDGSLDISVSPTIATYLPKGLEYLAKFPYGCAEQTLSSLLPNVAISRLQGFDAFKFVDDKTLKDMVTSGLERLYTFQRSDGGFGYWQESSRSYPYLSAYALFSLNLTKQSGYSVDQSVIERTRSYLDQALRTKSLAEPIDLATRASILYALSESGKVDVSLLKNLDEQRGKLPNFAKAFLAMAFENAGTPATKGKAADILTDIINTAKVDGRGTHFEEQDNDLYAELMHTNDRTTALVLQAILKIDPENSLTPNIVRYLLSVRKDGHWDTTQSTVYSLLSLMDYLTATEELDANFAATTQVNGKEILAWNVDKKNVLSRKEVTLALGDLLQGKENVVQIGKNGKGKLYYDLVLSYFYTADVLPPAEEGMGILRSIEPLPGQASSVTVGNTYRITLTITVPEERHFVAVESPLPAGMESIDLSLATSQQALLSDSTTRGNYWDEDYWRNGLWHFSHHEFRDDSVFLFADELPAGVYQYTYLVRATTPGTFHERPARVWEMYFPEVFGQTSGQLFTVKE